MNQKRKSGRDRVNGWETMRKGERGRETYSMYEWERKNKKRRRVNG